MKTVVRLTVAKNLSVEIRENDAHDYEIVWVTSMETKNIEVALEYATNCLEAVSKLFSVLANANISKFNYSVNDPLHSWAFYIERFKTSYETAFNEQRCGED